MLRMSLGVSGKKLLCSLMVTLRFHQICVHCVTVQILFCSAVQQPPPVAF